MDETLTTKSILEKIIDIEYEIKKLNYQLRHQKKSSMYKSETVDIIQKMIEFKRKRIIELQKTLIKTK